MEMDSVPIDIIEDTWHILLEFEKNGEVLSKQAPPSIYMVPSRFRDLSPSSFTPRLVAIGPLHSQDEHLQGFEVQKSMYLHNWFHRLGMVPEQTLRECVTKVIGSIERIKACYGGSIAYNDSELAKMMVIDACFILEFVVVLAQVFFSEGESSKGLIISSILPDLLLIENQIPFFVLEIIFECTFLVFYKEATLTEHIKILLDFFDILIEGNVELPNDTDTDHVLGLLHKYYRPAEPMQVVADSSMKHHTTVELDRAGIKFKPNTGDQNWALAMKLEPPLPLFPWLHNFKAIPQFSWFRRPTLRMPKMVIGDNSELIFRNLLVYEQSSDVKKYFTAYLTVMDLLVDTPHDVALLVKSEVLQINLGSYEEAVDIINNLSKNVVFGEFLYSDQWEEIDAYYNSYWPNTIAGLKRTYFNNPWSILALTAAFVLFALTVVQTSFTIIAV